MNAHTPERLRRLPSPVHLAHLGSAGSLRVELCLLHVGRHPRSTSAREPMGRAATAVQASNSKTLLAAAKIVKIAEGMISRWVVPISLLQTTCFSLRGHSGAGPPIPHGRAPDSPAISSRGPEKNPSPSNFTKISGTQNSAVLRFP